MDEDIFKNDHSILFHRNKLLFVGGVVSNEERGMPNLNNFIHIFNYINGQNIRLISVSNEFQTSSCSSIILPDHSILIPGGKQKRVSISSYKTMNPDTCFHWDK